LTSLHEISDAELTQSIIEADLKRTLTDRQKKVPLRFTPAELLLDISSTGICISDFFGAYTQFITKN
jgi:hypothetical protein